ncbi:hypothetical protein IWX49DRAFT_629490 [Phyllosticta citricarpa]|uniref:Uncharacterized protein n=2 Tax=Phyllosticta TaxID=121621 RepID=A0ABR1MES9_9PEZI
MPPKNRPSPITPGRPTGFDGKYERDVWQPEDGHGDPDPKTIEKHRSGEPTHPTWKLFMGEVPTGITAAKLAEHVPRYCYLDDKAVWAVSKIADLPKHDRSRYWPYDFTDKGGNISTVRRNRGRPAYNKTNRLANIQRARPRAPYWLCGGGSLKVEPPASTAAPKEDNNRSSTTTQEPSETPAPSIETQDQPSTGAREVDKPEEAKPKTLKKKEALSTNPPEPKDEKPEQAKPEKKVKNQVIGQLKPKKQLEDSAQEQQEKPKRELAEKLKRQKEEQKPKAQQEQEEESDEEDERPLDDPDAMALVRFGCRKATTPYSDPPSPKGLPDSTALVPRDFPGLQTDGFSGMMTPFTKPPKSLGPSSSSSNSSKRSSSLSSETPHPAKRQRSRLLPYNLPSEVKQRDDELSSLQTQIAKLKGRNAQLEHEHRGLQTQLDKQNADFRKCGQGYVNMKKQRDAFHQATKALRTHVLDKQDELAEFHRYCVGVVEREQELHRLVSENALAARRALQPLEGMHRGLQQVLDVQEERFRLAGLERVWEEVMDEEVQE